MKPQNFLIFILSCSLLMSGCKKNDDDPVTPPNGKISGQLKLADEFGNDAGSHSNVKVSVQTGEYGVSNAGGNFQITGLKTGIYNLDYVLAGYGTFRKFNIQVGSGSNGTTLNGVDILGAKSTTEISNLSVVLNAGDSTYTISCNVSPTPDATHQRAFRLFFSRNSGVNTTDYLYTPENKWVSTVATGNITGFQRQSLFSGGFQAGDSVYVVAVGESIITNVYTIPGETKKVYPNLNVNAPSNVVGFKLQ